MSTPRYLNFLFPLQNHQKGVIKYSVNKKLLSYLDFVPQAETPRHFLDQLGDIRWFSTDSISVSFVSYSLQKIKLWPKDKVNTFLTLLTDESTEIWMVL